MDSRRHALVAVGALLCALVAAPLSAAAQVWDPSVAVAAYSAALDVHDLPAALALFDQYGSATDAAGHHFEGRAGLTQFLLNSGFGSPDAKSRPKGCTSWPTARSGRTAVPARTARPRCGWS